MRFTAALAQVLKDPLVEAIRRNLQQQLDELKALVCVGLKPIIGVAMPASGVVRVKHGLGRAPIAVFVSPPRTPDGVGLTVGLIQETRGTVGGLPVDSTQEIAFVIGAFSNPFTVDVLVL